MDFKGIAPTDDELRALWRSKGGSFHGPRIETGTMPEAALLAWLRELVTTPPNTLVVQPAHIVFGGGCDRYSKKAVGAAQRLAGLIAPAEGADR